MKFVLNINQFSPNIKEVDLTEKEVDYIVMLASGVQDEKIKELLNINHSELEVLYQKFGLTNKQRVRDLQLTTVMAMNNLITPELIMHTKERINLIELKEMIDFYKKNSKESDRYFQILIQNKNKSLKRDLFIILEQYCFLY